MSVPLVQSWIVATMLTLLEDQAGTLGAIRWNTMKALTSGLHFRIRGNVMAMRSLSKHLSGILTWPGLQHEETRGYRRAEDTWLPCISQKSANLAP